MTNPRPLSGSSVSPPRPPESATEVLYNTAVQSFVRRDHLKSHATLSRLLSSLKAQSRKQPRKRWHDLSPGNGHTGQTSAQLSETAEGDVEEWLIKTFKLYISSQASLYTDPPQVGLNGRAGGAGGAGESKHLPGDMADLAAPNPPHRVLEHVVDTALQAYPDGILPPPLISTLILAALKLRPADDALGYVHRITEEWLASLPDGFMDGISRRNNVGKRVEAGREGYLKVLELFTGEVLARESEWEMARGILDGDTLLGSRRKEALYRHLRSVQTRRETPTPSSSLVLPSPSNSLTLPDGSTTATPKARSRSSSATSASSSEATARPTFAFPTASRFSALGKGKQKADSTESESTLPSRIIVNPPSAPRRATPSGRGEKSTESWSGIMRFGLNFLPPAVRDRLERLNTLQVLSVGLPLPILGLFLLFVAVRRRTRRGTIIPAPLGDVRARLLAARRQGLWTWFMLAMKWWMGKVAGVWKLGTTITYV